MRIIFSRLPGSSALAGAVVDLDPRLDVEHVDAELEPAAAILHGPRLDEDAARDEVPPLEHGRDPVQDVLAGLIDKVCRVALEGQHPDLVQKTRPGDQVQRVVVLYDPRQPEIIYKMINPKIVWKSDNMVESQEGCLSLPGMSATVSRHEKVTVEYLDETFTKKTLEADGILAICIQHETDHLDGKLYIDRLPTKERADFVKNFNKLRESFEQQAQ